MGLVDSLIGGVFDLGATAIGAYTAKNQQAREQAFNAEQAELNRQFNADEAEKARNFNAKESELARQYNTAEREAAQDWNLDMWEREKQYNSASAQMERAMAAGINPNAVAQGISGGADAGSLRTSAQSGPAASGPAASGSAASSPSSIAGELASLIGNSVNTFWQNQVLSKQAEGQGIQNDYDKLSMDDRLGLLKDQRSQIQSQLKLSDQEWKQAEEMFPYLLGEKQTDIQLKLKQIDELVSQINLQDEQSKSEEKKRDVMDSEIDVNDSILGVNEEKVNESKVIQRKLASENRELLWKEGLRNIGFDPDNSPVGNLLMQGYRESAETGDIGNNPAVKTLKNAGKIIDIATWAIPTGIGIKGAAKGYKAYKGYKAAKVADKLKPSSKELEDAIMKLWKQGTLWNPIKKKKQ